MKKIILTSLLLASSFCVNAQDTDQSSKWGYSVAGKFGSARLESTGAVDTKMDLSGTDFSVQYDHSKSVSFKVGFGMYNAETNLTYNGAYALFEQRMLQIPVGIIWRPSFGEKKSEWVDFSLGLDIYGKTITKSKFSTVDDSQTVRNFDWNVGTAVSMYLDFHVLKSLDVSAGIESFSDLSKNKKEDVKQKIVSSNLLSFKVTFKFD